MLAQELKFGMEHMFAHILGFVLKQSLAMRVKRNMLSFSLAQRLHISTMSGILCLEKMLIWELEQKSVTFGTMVAKFNFESMENV
jgi:hypothetical protein